MSRSVSVDSAGKLVVTIACPPVSPKGKILDSPTAQSRSMSDVNSINDTDNDSVYTHYTGSTDLSLLPPSPYRPDSVS
jgi:hypothetical protein